MNDLAYISLGTNMGNRYNFLSDAVIRINENPNIDLVNISSIYETDPVGYEDQDPFLNMVIEVKTSLSPLELLQVCENIEQLLGRKREFRWGPRTIDLDILLYNQENMVTEKLTIPHPRLHERAFVIIPLLEINSTVIHPKMEIPIKDYLKNLSDREGVRIWKRRNGEDVFALFEN